MNHIFACTLYNITQANILSKSELSPGNKVGYYSSASEKKILNFWSFKRFYFYDLFFLLKHFFLMDILKVSVLHAIIKLSLGLFAAYYLINTPSFIAYWEKSPLPIIKMPSHHIRQVSVLNYSCKSFTVKLMQGETTHSSGETKLNNKQ